MQSSRAVEGALRSATAPSCGDGHPAVATLGDEFRERLRGRLGGRSRAEEPLEIDRRDPSFLRIRSEVEQSRVERAQSLECVLELALERANLKASRAWRSRASSSIARAAAMISCPSSCASAKPRAPAASAVRRDSAASSRARRRSASASSRATARISSAASSAAFRTLAT